MPIEMTRITGQEQTKQLTVHASLVTTFFLNEDFFHYFNWVYAIFPGIRARLLLSFDFPAHIESNDERLPIGVCFFQLSLNQNGRNPNTVHIRMEWNGMCVRAFTHEFVARSVHVFCSLSLRNNFFCRHDIDVSKCIECAKCEAQKKHFNLRPTTTT